MAQDDPYTWKFFSPTYAPWFAPDTTTTTSTIMGSNIQEGDGPIERRVLEDVGSYGYQINRIVDVLMILLKQAAAHNQLPGNLKPNFGKDSDSSEDDHKNHPKDDPKKSINDFIKMARDAAKASEAYKEQATDLAVERLIQRMERLKKTDPPRYKRFREKIEKGLPK